MVKETYKIMEDGRVEYTYKTDDVELKNLDNTKTIGKYYNMGINYIDNKDVCLADLSEKYDKYSEDLESVNNQLGSIEVNDTIAEELKQIIDNSVKIFDKIRELKDVGGESFIANNPKKYGRMLRELRLLKEMHIGELKNIDNVTGLHNKKQELLKQQKLYSEQVEKIKRQLEEVKRL